MVTLSENFCFYYITESGNINLKIRVIFMKAVCFTGHRYLDCDLEDLKFRVYDALERMIKNAGITDFYNGGAVGWDMLTAQEVLKLREKYPHIKLHMVLPCSPESQSYKWTTEQKKTYFL